MREKGVCTTFVILQEGRTKLRWDMKHKIGWVAWSWEVIYLHCG